jgi:hypothetical protein
MLVSARVTGCGCLLLIATMVALLLVLIFGSTDPGEPIDTAVALLLSLWLGQRLALVPLRRALVRAGGA